VFEHGWGTSWRVGRAVLPAPWVCLPLALLGLAPNFAAAGCGDYVIFRPQASPGSLITEQLPAGGAELMLPAKAPCHSPLCRGNRPAEPAPTPPNPPQFEQRPLALLSGGAEVECPFLAGRGWPRLDESPLDGFAVSLLRPPCA
jgi:hypothetical protein